MIFENGGVVYLATRVSRLAEAAAMPAPDDFEAFVRKNELKLSRAMADSEPDDRQRTRRQTANPMTDSEPDDRQRTRRQTANPTTDSEPDGS
jgi:hypothetical protein